MNRLWKFAVVASSLLVGACAYIVNGSTQDVAISSQPSGANIKIVDHNRKQIFTGQTPATVTLDRKKEFFEGGKYEVTITKKGYRPFHVTLTSRPSWWYLAGNLLLPVVNLVAWVVVDPATGAMWTLEPDSVDSDMAPLVGETDGSTLKIMLVEDVPAELKDRLVRVN